MRNRTFDAAGAAVLAPATTSSRARTDVATPEPSQARPASENAQVAKVGVRAHWVRGDAGLTLQFHLE